MALSVRTRGRIYQRVLNACGPPEWPAAWGFLVERTDAVGSVADAQSLLAELSTEFSERDLVEAGVLRRSSGAEVQLADALLGTLLIPLRPPLSEQCTDLLSCSGVVAGRSLPLIAALEDAHTHIDQDTADSRLFVTANLMDTALLRALGLPAAPASGLDRLQVDEATELGRRCGAAPIRHESGGRPLDGFSAPANPLQRLADTLREECAAAAATRCRLTFAAWSLQSLTRREPPEITEALGCWEQFSRYLTIELPNVDVWCPSDHELERLKFLRKLRRIEELRQAVLESTRESARTLTQYRDEQRSRACGGHGKLDSGQLSAALVRAWSDRGRAPGAAAARQECLDLLARQLLVPVVEESFQTKSPRETLLTLQLAEVARHFFSCSLNPACVGAPEADGVPHGRHGPDRTQIHNVLELAKRAESILKQLGAGGD